MELKNKISYITPKTEFLNKKIILDKSYSQEFKLNNGSYIEIASDIGKRRNQQDSLTVAYNNGYVLLLVADGIGGYENGELASYTTVNIINKWFMSEYEDTLKVLSAKTLEDVLNALIYLISSSIPSRCGTTINMSIIGPQETFIVNIGDSRTYSIKNENISIRSKDDSLVFRDLNPQTTEERDRLRFHKRNNIITNSISNNTYPNIKISTINNNEYDILIHLTDGVSDYLDEQKIFTYAIENNPATKLVYNTVAGRIIYNKNEYNEEYRELIYPGEDNSTAIVYSKKLIKNR